jgi:Tol biopolymer transport system component
MAPVAPSGHVEGSPVKLLDGRYRHQHFASWSPDGENLVFTRRDEEHNREIWTISVPDGSLTQVTAFDVAGYRGPEWSPDGESIAYWKKGGVWLSPAKGGNARMIIEFGGDPFWSPDGKWLHHSNREVKQLFCLADSQKIDLMTPEEVGNFIAFSPDSKKMFFYRPSYNGKVGFKVVSFSGGPSFEPGGIDLVDYSAQWSADSKIIIAKGKNEVGDITYWIVPFEGGEPFIFNIDVAIDEKPFPFEISPNNKKLAFTLSHDDGSKDLYIVPISVKDARTTGSADLVFKRWSPGARAGNADFSWSPDGNNLALVHEEDIWVVPLSGGKSFQITYTPEAEKWIDWSPDGKMISYYVVSKKMRSLHIVSASGGKSIMVLNNCQTSNWSLNSQLLSVVFEDKISIFGIDGKQKRQIINLKDLDLDGADTPMWSPNGKHLAFIGYKKEVEKPLVFMIPSVGGKVTELASDDNSYKYLLRWSPDGKWISYITEETIKVRPEGTLWEADFEELVEKLQE